MTKEDVNKFLGEMINEVDTILKKREVDHLTRQEIRMFLYVRATSLLKKLAKEK